jgi:uncharacterized delta-60 repeat protein
MIQGAVITGDTRRTEVMKGPPALGCRRWGYGLVLAVLLGLSGVGMGHGAPGDLDPTFGTGGIAVSFGPHDVVRAMVQQPDGKLVVAGTSFNQTVSVGFILLVRYLPDGGGDPAFGAGGKVTVQAGNSSSATALVLQPDGNLVVAGTSDPAPANTQTPTAFLVRYRADGRVDASFGTEGTVTIGRGGVPGGASPGPCSCNRMANWWWRRRAFPSVWCASWPIAVLIPLLAAGAR